MVESKTVRSTLCSTSLWLLVIQYLEPNAAAEAWIEMAEQTCHSCGNPVTTPFCTSCGAVMKAVPIETAGAGIAESSKRHASRSLVVGLIVALVVLVGGVAFALSQGNGNDNIVVGPASNAENAPEVTTTMAPATTIEVAPTTSIVPPPPPPTTTWRAPSTTAVPVESERSNTAPVINWLETCPSFSEQAIAWFNASAIPGADPASLVIASNYRMLGASWTISHTDGRPNQAARYIAMCNPDGTIGSGNGFVN